MGLKKIKRKIKRIIDITIISIICGILLILSVFVFLDSQSIKVDISYIIDIALKVTIGCVAVIVLVFTLAKIRNRRLLMSVTDPSRGTKTERQLVLKLLKKGVDARMLFHDLYLEKHGGGYAQLDLVAITDVGIVVFEVKKYSGWIYGRGNMPNWTQVLAHGDVKNYFYNPIIQNSRHIVELKKQLREFGEVPFYSVVVFYGDCEFKEIALIPQGSYLVKEKRVWEVMKLIRRRNEPIEYLNKHKIAMVLDRAAGNGEDSDIQDEHIESINDLMGKDRIFE